MNWFDGPGCSVRGAAEEPQHGEQHRVGMSAGSWQLAWGQLETRLPPGRCLIAASPQAEGWSPADEDAAGMSWHRRRAAVEWQRRAAMRPADTTRLGQIQNMKRALPVYYGFQNCDSSLVRPTGNIKPCPCSHNLHLLKETTPAYPFTPHVDSRRVGLGP